MITAYNGYRNYETWAVNMWLNADLASHHVLHWIARIDRPAAQRAEALSEMVTNDKHYLAGQSSLWADIIHAAIARVDWVEIVIANQD